MNYQKVMGLVDDIQFEIVDVLQRELHQKLALRLTPAQRGLFFQLALLISWIEQYMSAESVIDKKRVLLDKQKEVFKEHFKAILKDDVQQVSCDNAARLMSHSFDNYYLWLKETQN